MLSHLPLHAVSGRVYHGAVSRSCVGACRVVLLACGLAVPAGAADRIILRNLDVIADQQVKHFDEDGVVLADGRLIPWDQIESSRLDADRQPAFDRMLKDLGGHLYRVRRRLETGDYLGLLPHAEAVFPRYVSRTSTTSYMVFQSLMWSRLAAGRREAALEPMLLCYSYLRATKQDPRAVALPGRRRLQIDMQTGLAAALPPVWFDPDQAQQMLAPVARVIAQMSKPRPAGARVYYATLALAAGKPETAKGVLEDMGDLESMRRMVLAQADFLAGKTDQASAQFAVQIAQLPSDQKPLASYWLGRARLASSDADTVRRGMLNLLSIAADAGDRQPDLAAAGLYEVMQKLAQQGDMAGSIAVRRELMDRYRQTWHAALLRKETQVTRENR